jgi:hypothetical protein
MYWHRHAEFERKPGILPGFFVDSSRAASSQDMTLTEHFSNSRQRAEAAFGKTQTLARDRTISEIDAVTQARDEKTSRLRALRMAKEAGDLAASDQEKAKRTGK